MCSKISKKSERKRSDRKANVKRRQDRDRKKSADRGKVSTPIKERHHLQNKKMKVMQNKKDGGEGVHDNEVNEENQSQNQGEFPYIDKAVRYLEHYGKEQEGDQQHKELEEASGNCSWTDQPSQDLMMTRNNQSAKLKGNLTWKSSSVRPRSSNSDLRIGTEYCRDFINTGSCSKRYCKYQHIDISSSYPKHSKELVKSLAIKPSNEPMKVQTHRQTKASGICHHFSKHGTCTFGNRCRYKHVSRHRPRNQGICHQFVNNGSCRFGSNCKFNHVHVSQDSRVSYVNQNVPKPSLNNRDDHVNFLEEIRSLVNTVKALVGSQQTSTAPPPMAFAGYQAQQFLPHQVCPVIPQQ